MGRFKASSVQGLWCLFFLSDLGPVPTPEMLQEEERQWKAKEPAVCRRGHIWGSTLFI